MPKRCKSSGKGYIPDTGKSLKEVPDKKQSLGTTDLFDEINLFVTN